MNRAQQSGYGLGQGPPPTSGGRFSTTPSRQGSTPLSPQQQQMRQPFAFGQGQMGLQAMSPQPGAQMSHAVPEASLDPSDFPALGGGAPPQGPTSASTAAHLAAQQAHQHLAQQQHRQQQQHQQQHSQQQQQNLLSSYASQASPATPAPPSTAATNSTPNGAAPRRTAGDSAPDDFPALGGLPHLANGGSSASPSASAAAPGQPLLPPGMGMGMFGSAGTGAAPGAGSAAAAGDLSALAQGVDTLSLAAARAAVSQGGQEQASALAALQAQQQHRASLLGAMNAQRGAGAGAAAGGFAPPGGDKTSWTQSPQQTPRFPAGLAPNGSTSSTSAGSSPLPPSAADAPHPPPPPHPSLPDPRSPSSALSAPPPPATGALPPPTAGVTTGGVPQTPAQQVLFSPADRYGLLGLLHIIKTSDPDTSMLALGTDLTNLGLDLGSTENLYSTFITPWTDSKAAAVLNIEPEFHLPSCYNVQPPPANTKIGNFSDETLFFIFYSQPRDAMQEMAAHELYKHNWRYHKELRLWLTKEAGTEPVQKTATFERGSYIFFDPVLWERVRKEYVLFFDQLETRRADVARGAAGGGGGGGASAAGSL